MQDVLTRLLEQLEVDPVAGSEDLAAARHHTDPIWLRPEPRLRWGLSPLRPVPAAPGPRLRASPDRSGTAPARRRRSSSSAPARETPGCAPRPHIPPPRPPSGP